MTARVITESYDGGSIAVDVEVDIEGGGRHYVSVVALEVDDHAGTVLWFTRREALDLAQALMGAGGELSPVPVEAIDTNSTHIGPAGGAR